MKDNEKDNKKLGSQSIFEEEKPNHDKLLALFDSPKLIGVVGDANSGKSNLLYFIVDSLMKKYKFKLFSYGLRVNIAGEIKIYSVEQLEILQDSIIIIDEFASFFDVDNRKEKKQIEQTLRLIFHNNNVVLFCGLSENYKKFIASKLDAVIFKRCALGDMINGSRVKSLAMQYGGYERGAAILNIPKDSALLYDGELYHKVSIPYMAGGDTKANNNDILLGK
jgi:hypothetical protein